VHRDKKLEEVQAILERAKIRDAVEKYDLSQVRGKKHLRIDVQLKPNALEALETGQAFA
jgi:hypothetical protein